MVLPCRAAVSQMVLVSSKSIGRRSFQNIGERPQAIQNRRKRPPVTLHLRGAVFDKTLQHRVIQAVCEETCITEPCSYLAISDRQSLPQHAGVDGFAGLAAARRFREEEAGAASEQIGLPIAEIVEH